MILRRMASSLNIKRKKILNFEQPIAINIVRKCLEILYTHSQDKVLPSGDRIALKQMAVK